MDPELAGYYGVLPGTTGAVDGSSASPIAGDTGIATGTATGQQGVTPLLGSGDATVTDAVNDVWEWLNTPFKSYMSPIGVFALIGSALVAILLWNLILYHIRIAAETI
jgi:hypothetical protein